MDPVLLTWALLGPPAILGIAVALESWTHYLQDRRRHPATVAELEHRLEARRRHPAGTRIPLEDSPEWQDRP